MAAAGPETTGWVPVARAPDVGTTPVPVGAGGRAYVVVRLRPDGEVSASAPEPVPPPPVPDGPLFGNLDPSLEHAWHPVALSRELRPGGWSQVRLLGRTWTLRRTGDGVRAEPPAYGVRERLGVVWVAPAAPGDLPVDRPELLDRRFVSGWVPPVRSAGPAALVVDALLDGAHHPFVRGVPDGAPGGADALDVVEEAGGFRGVREHDGPAGQCVRTVYDYRAPFHLLVRQELAASGAVTAAQFALQPEDDDSTRVYARLLLSAGPGRRLPTPSAVVEEMARLHDRLEEYLRLQARMSSAGLPLDTRVERHVPTDRLGLAMRRALCDFTGARGLRSAT